MKSYPIRRDPKVFKDSFSITTASFRALVVFTDQETPQITVIIAKKKAKLASKRNKIKRVVKAKLQLNKTLPKNTGIVIVVKNPDLEVLKVELEKMVMDSKNHGN